MHPSSIVLLEFHPERDDLGKDKELRDGLSVALQIGDNLWVANDETISLERLSLEKQSKNSRCRRAASHKQFALHDYLRLPEPPTGNPDDLKEVDIEGLAHADGYLWLVGSHSLKRSKPKSKDGAGKAQKRLAKISHDANRYLLARIPMVEENGTTGLARQVVHKGRERLAAQLHGHGEGNDLTEALKNDVHLAPFLAIPGKDNGFDIEGLAVVGKRIFLGLRGPVLRGWAMILEVELEESRDDPSLLQLKPIGDGKCPYLKHFLELGGLGIRDMCVQGSDLLILAGPTMDLDGPVTVSRWRGGASPKEESVVAACDLEHVMNLPFGDGVDHPEGITLFAADGGKADSLLVVYDSASVSRQLGESTLVADVFKLL